MQSNEGAGGGNDQPVAVSSAPSQKPSLSKSSSTVSGTKSPTSSGSSTGNGAGSVKRSISDAAPVSDRQVYLISIQLTHSTILSMN